MPSLKSVLGLLFVGVATAAPQAAQPSASSSSSAASPSAIGNSSSSLTSDERDELFSLHEELVNIPSISGEELECADFVKEYLEELGYYVDKVPVGNKSSYNVFAYPQELKDEGGWPEVLITSHIDTVSHEFSLRRSSLRNPRCHLSIHLSEEKRMAQSTTLAAAL